MNNLVLQTTKSLFRTLLFFTIEKTTREGFTTCQRLLNEMFTV